MAVFNGGRLLHSVLRVSTSRLFISSSILVTYKLNFLILIQLKLSGKNCYL